MPNVLISSAPLGALTVAAATSFSLRLTLLGRNLNLRNLLRCMATCATSIPNTTVSSTSLSSIGVLQRHNFVKQVVQRQLERWSKLLSNALTVSCCSKSGGMSLLSLLSMLLLCSCWSSRFANRSARFISAYREGLSGAQAAWANKRYHGHRTLPPEMIAAARAS